MEIVRWVASIIASIFFIFMVWAVMSGKVSTSRKQNIDEMHLDKAKEKLRKRHKRTQ